MTTQLIAPTKAAGASHVFDRVLVGIDRSPASLEAARQAALLTEHYGELTLLGAYPPPSRLGSDIDDLDVAHTRRQCEKAVDAAAAAIGSLVAAETLVTRGYSASTLMREAA